MKTEDIRRQKYDKIDIDYNGDFKHSKLTQRCIEIKEVVLASVINNCFQPIINTNSTIIIILRK